MGILHLWVILFKTQGIINGQYFLCA